MSGVSLVSGWGLLLSAGLFLFSGCNVLSPKAIPAVATPPDIPAPALDLPSEAPPTDSLAVESRAALLKGLEALNAEDPRTPTLKEAAHFAIEKDLFTLPSADLMAEPSLRLTDPVTRGELAVWLATFAKLPPRVLQNPTFQDVTLEDSQVAMKDVPLIEAVAHAGLMSGFPESGKTLFKPNEFIQRDAFCVLYGRTSGKAGDLAALSDVKARRTVPAGWEEPEDTLERFKDFAAVPVVSRKAVALAYRDHLLEKVFNLQPEQLIEGEGLHPEWHLTRGEALIFLGTLYPPSRPE